MSYWFSVVRFVPEPARGECVNVGVIATNEDGSEFRFQTAGNLKRARALSGDHQKNVGAIAQMMADLENEAEDAAEAGRPSPISPEELGKRAGEMRNLVQLVPPRPIIASSCEEALRLAFEELVVDPATRAIKSHVKKSTAVAQLRRAYAAIGLSPLADPSMRIGADETGFDFAVANGRAVQLVRCWSFQGVDQERISEEVRAWAWTVRSMRKAGPAYASLRATGKEVPLDKNVEVDAFFVPPDPGQGEAPAFEVAQAAFRDGDTQIVPVALQAAEDLAKRGQALLTSSH